MTAKLVIIDRDGVINEDSDHYIKSADEWCPIPGSIEAIAALSKAGYKIAVATNQSGISRGLFDEATLAEMHEKLHTLVEAQGGRIDGIFICIHHPDDNCQCRKPRTGLLEQIEEEFGMALGQCWFIGDSEKDLDCALAKGCQPVLVLTGKGQGTLTGLSPEKKAQCHLFNDLRTAGAALLCEAPGAED